MNIQYIGARYVPIIYTNPDDGSADWKSGESYEPLTIVTYLDDSYTSKIPVPATVGNPADNSVYWVKTGNYNAALTNLQNQVTDIKDLLGNESLDTISQTITGAINEVLDMLYYVTPEQFGAVGDGVTNDSIAIQAAIDAVNAAGGGVVQFNKKAYIAQGLIPKNNVTLKGTGASTIKLPAVPTSHMFVSTTDETIDNFNIMYMMLDGRNQTTYDIIHITPANLSPAYFWDRSIVDGVWFTGAKTGIVCGVPGNVKIVNTIFKDNDVGFEQTIEHVHMTNVMFWHNRIGAKIHTANHFTWTNVTFAHNTEYGIDGDAGTNEACLIGCNFIDTPTCIHGSFNTYRIVNCRMINCEKAIDGLFNSNVLTGCYIAKMSDVAVTMLTGSIGNVVSDNVFYLNKTDMEVVGVNHNIHGNSFRQTKRSAIELSQEPAGLLGISINGNTFYNQSDEANNTYPCIHETCDGLIACMICDNMFRNSGAGKASYGIEFDTTFDSINDVLIANNIARSMKTAGYKLVSSTGLTLDNNIGTVTTP